MTYSTPVLSAALSALGRADNLRGSPVENFTAIACLCNDLFGLDMSALQCCQVMVSLKLMRMCRDPLDLDTKADLAAYLDIMHRLQEAECWPPDDDDLPF